MLNRILVVSALSLTLVAGAANAQTGGGGGGDVDSHTAGASTPDGRVVFEGWRNETIRAFFTDETMLHMHSDDDMRVNWAALPADDQAQIRADCEKVESNRESYGEVSVTLCSQIGAY